MDSLERAIAGLAVLTAATSVLIVWLLTEGDWYFQAAAGLSVWATCWIGMGITARFDDE